MKLDRELLQALDGRGHRRAETMLRLDERGRFLRAAADRYCIGLSGRAAAAWLHTKIVRYRAGSWRRDRTEATCPARHRGTINEFCWMVLKAADNIISERSIRRALADRLDGRRERGFA
ncbi:hypothetical protein [Bradyrhizobium sp. McL0616]|uniref:hypothetical protein n=1 Tax=Bradyrhizobium sp. McL0616 TaxID=3415674 RepID=UPI003CFB3645